MNLRYDCYLPKRSPKIARKLFSAGLGLAAISTVMTLGTSPSLADSPLTSTPFSNAYQDYEIVQRAKRTGILDLTMAEYLSSPSAPIDIKAALINALSWDFKGKKNAVLYRYFLGVKYGRTLEEGLSPNAMTADEAFAMGYLTAMDDYFNPDKALPFLRVAFTKKPDSLTVGMIRGLVQAQSAFDSNWCTVWRKVSAPSTNSDLQPDLRPQAKAIILDYMRGYESSCTSPR
ncbi:MAG TPA: hypothetical protein V6D19_19125 [Stenomitos sp.]